MLNIDEGSVLINQIMCSAVVYNKDISLADTPVF